MSAVVVDLRPRLVAWHTCDLLCVCGHRWYAAVHRRELDAPIECPSCLARHGEVVSSLDEPRVIGDAQWIAETATRGRA